MKFSQLHFLRQTLPELINSILVSDGITEDVLERLLRKELSLNALQIIDELPLQDILKSRNVYGIPAPNLINLISRINSKYGIAVTKRTLTDMKSLASCNYTMHRIQLYATCIVRGLSDADRQLLLSDICDNKIASKELDIKWLIRDEK